MSTFVCGTGLAQTVIHPTKENIPVSSGPRFELRHEADGSDAWKWESFEIAEIGVEEGDYLQMLGMVWDLELDHKGTLYYLDYSTRKFVLTTTTVIGSPMSVLLELAQEN